AEDGIRDKLVTGVQTCALPIYEAAEERFASDEAGGHGHTVLLVGGGRFLLPHPAGDPPDAHRDVERARQDQREPEGGGAGDPGRSEERRVGKEGGAGWWRSR